MWQARYNDAARRSVLPAWEIDSIPILDSALASFEAAHIEDLSAARLRTDDGEPVNLGVIRSACGNTKKYIDLDKAKLLTYRDLFRFTDESIAPPLGLIFNPCTPHLIASFDAGSFSVLDETFRVALILDYSCGVQHATQLRYAVFREFGHESLQCRLAGHKTAISLRAMSDVPKVVFRGLAAFWDRRDAIIGEMCEEFIDLANHSPTTPNAEYLINNLYVTKLEMPEEAEPKTDAEWQDYNHSMIRRFLRTGFLNGRNEWIDTRAAYGTLLGLWFSVAEIENFKACRDRTELPRQLIVRERAEQMRKSFAYLWRTTQI